MSATAVTAAGDGGDRVFFGSHCAARLLGKPVRDVNRQVSAAQRRREQAERTARYTAQRETERVEAMAVGFYADLDGINAYVLARACVRFASDPHLIASRRAGLPERDRAHPRGRAAMNVEPATASPQAAASAVVAALERAWIAIRTHHPDVPQVVVVLGAGSEARRGLFKWGHFAAARWQVAGANRPEVLVSGEGLKRGAPAVLATLLHEAAHGLANTRQVKDTSRQGRWHNRRFATLAGEIGLHVEKDAKTGWSQTSLTSQLAARYAEQLTGLDAALGLWRHTERQLGPAAGSRNLLACSCACGRKLRVSRTTLEQAPIICGACEERFEPQRALTLSRQPAAPPDPPRRRSEDADAPRPERRDLPEHEPRPARWREQPITTWRNPREGQRPAREGGHER